MSDPHRWLIVGALALLAGALCCAWWAWRAPEAVRVAEQEVAAAVVREEDGRKRLEEATVTWRRVTKQSDREVATAYEKGLDRGRALSGDAVSDFLRERIRRVRVSGNLPASGDLDGGGNPDE